MAGEGLDLRHVRTDESHPTGFMLKEMALDGRDPEVEYFRRGSAASHMSPADMPAAGSGFRQARLLHLTGILPALSAGCAELAFALARQARADGRTVSFDPNLRPRLWPRRPAMVTAMNELASLADLVMPGLAEGRLLTGRQDPAGIADFYLERGARQVVVKLGPEGAYVAGAVGTTMSGRGARHSGARGGRYRRRRRRLRGRRHQRFAGRAAAARRRRARQRHRRARGAVPRRLRRLADPRPASKTKNGDKRMKTIKGLRWLVISLVALATIINYIDRSALAVMWPGIASDLGMDKRDYANIVTIFLVGYAVGQSLFGKLFDALGTRVAFLLSIVVWSGAIALHFVARSALSFSLFRALLGVGEAGNWPGATKAIAEWFPVRERALRPGDLRRRRIAGFRDRAAPGGPDVRLYRLENHLPPDRRAGLPVDRPLADPVQIGSRHPSLDRRRGKELHPVRPAAQGSRGATTMRRRWASCCATARAGA
jgi:hypothetical protein